MNPGLQVELEPVLMSALPAGASGTPRVVVERRLEALAPEWDDLARRAGAGPFLRPGWIEAWWRAFGQGRLEVFTLRRDGRLLAVLPLVRRGGALRSATNWHTPEFGLLAESPSASAELLESLFRLARPDRVRLAALAPAEPTLEACRRAAESSGYRTLIRPYQSSPFLELEGDWSRYESRLSRNLRHDLERSRRRLERLGPLTVEATDGGQRLDELLREAFAVEASGWKGDDRTAIQSAPATARFYGDLARWAAEEGMLRLWFLRLGRRALSTYYALEDDGVLHLLKGGYEAEFRHFSPGKLLIHRVLEQAFAEGCRRVEFHGDAEPYKLRWTDTVRERQQLEAFAPTAAGRLAWTLRARLRPALKRLLGRAADAPPAPARARPTALPANHPSALPTDGGTS